MTITDLLVLAASFALAPAYLCRLDALSLRHHRAPVVLLHLVLFVGCISTGYHAWVGLVDLSDVCALSAAALWIAVSWHTWRGGVPEHVERAVLIRDDAVLARVVGGIKERGDRS